MSKGNRFIYEHHHYHHYKNENILFDKKTKNDENTSAKSSTSSLFSRKSKTKAKKLKKESRSNSLINNKQQFQHDDIIKNNISDPEAFTATFSTLVNRSNQSQVPNFNLSKIQTKKCMRSFRLRRAIKKQKNLLNNLDLFSNRKKSPPSSLLFSLSLSVLLVIKYLAVVVVVKKYEEKFIFIFTNLFAISN